MERRAGEDVDIGRGPIMEEEEGVGGGREEGKEKKRNKGE